MERGGWRPVGCPHGVTFGAAHGAGRFFCPHPLPKCVSPACGFGSAPAFPHTNPLKYARKQPRWMRCPLASPSEAKCHATTSPYAACLVGKICGPLCSTWGASLGEGKSRERVGKILCVLRPLWICVEVLMIFFLHMDSLPLWSTSYRTYISSTHEHRPQPPAPGFKAVSDPAMA